MKPLIEYILETRMDVLQKEGIDALVTNFDFETSGSGNSRYPVKDRKAYKLIMCPIVRSKGCLRIEADDITNKFSNFVWMDDDENERSIAYTAPITEIIKLIAQYVDDFQKLSPVEMNKKYSGNMWPTNKELYKYDASEVDALRRSNFAFTTDYLSKQPWFVTLDKK